MSVIHSNVQKKLAVLDRSALTFPYLHFLLPLWVDLLVGLVNDGVEQMPRMENRWKKTVVTLQKSAGLYDEKGPQMAI